MRLLTRALESLGCSIYPWDGVGDPGLLERLKEAEDPTGLYAAFLRRSGSSRRGEDVGEDEEGDEGGKRNGKRKDAKKWRGGDGGDDGGGGGGGGGGIDVDCSGMRWLAPHLPDIPGDTPSWLRPPDGAEATWVNAAAADPIPSSAAAAAFSKKKRKKSRADFLARLLDVAAGAFPSHASLALARVEHERRRGGTAAAKACAKSMLADRHGSCIPLWIAFARLERSSGRKQAARKVYDRIINKLPQLSPREASMSAATLALACADDELDGDGGGGGGGGGASGGGGEGGGEAWGRALGALVWLAEFSLGGGGGGGGEGEGNTTAAATATANNNNNDNNVLESFPGGAAAIPPLRLLRVRKGLQELVGRALARGGGGGGGGGGGSSGAAPSPLGLVGGGRSLLKK